MRERRNWDLSADAFDRLLAFLDADRERAAEAYEQIRRRLLKFFEWRGSANPEELADRVIDRVARRLMQERELKADNRYVYFHGVALNVLREHWREPGRQAEPIEKAEPVANPHDETARRERLERERLLTVLEECVRKLAPASRDLVVEYHGAGVQIEARKSLAHTLGIPLNALRIRVYRIRAALEVCADRAMKQISETGIPG
jgi:DNA-directed RNA polymerase specialized sigma24 family protein